MDTAPSHDTNDRIDLDDAASCELWLKKLNTTHQQLREAVHAVGNSAGDVEMHLKGTRSTSNDEKVEQALQAGEGEVR